MKSLCVIFLCSLLVSCGDLASTAWGIWVENKSTEDVYFIVGMNYVDGKFYPTTQVPLSNECLILVGTGQRHPIRYIPVRNVMCSADTPIAVFVFSAKDVEAMSWKELREGERYLKKYEFTCGMLGQFNVNPLTYP